MKFVRETLSAVTIRRVTQGEITVGNDTIRDNVILFREEAQAGFAVSDPAAVTEADFATLIERKPEIIIYGAGWRPTIPPRDVVFAMARHGIGFECMDTPAACRTFNILVSEDRDVAAALVVV
jgi:uncharacterized protein